MNFWENYIEQLTQLERLGASVFCIGNSTLGRPIFCVRVGNGKKKIIAQYAIHAREHITYHLAILHIKKLLREKIQASVFILPITNPDGVCLAVEGLDSVRKINDDLSITTGHFPFCPHIKELTPLRIKNIKKFLLHINKSKDFSLWKANINAVDLNVNFDAKWGQGKQNVYTPNSENFIGKFPESEPETKTLVNFTRVIHPDMSISYHSKGEVLFYRFGQQGAQLKRDKKIASAIRDLTGYPIKTAHRSVGGYKDWCIQRMGIPSLTIEVGASHLSHPISKVALPEIWAQNRNVISKSVALLEDFDI